MQLVRLSLVRFRLFVTVRGIKRALRGRNVGFSTEIGARQLLMTLGVRGTN